MKTYLTLITFLLQFVLHAQVITTFAGNGLSGYTGDNDSAKFASVGNVGLLCFDASENLYLTSFNNTVREITSSNIIYTVAGNGTTGYSGDNGLATIAQLNGPSGVAVDDSGNVYIAETYDHRIRKVNKATGIITTIAGNGTPGFSGDNDLATLAQLNSPIAVAIDTSGNLYISDANNYRIRKIDKNGIITTFAGNGIGGFAGNEGLAVNASLWTGGLHFDIYNNLYVGCLQQIRKINLLTGIITSVAGDTIVGFGGYGDGGRADTSKFWYAIDAIPDKLGNLFISDQNDNRIRMVDMSGIIHTVVGNGVGGWSGDNDLAINAEINSPRGLAIDSCGNLYIADNGNRRIRKVAFNPACWPVEVKTPVKAMTINLYPNPAYNNITITAPTPIGNVSISNMFGQQVYTHTFSTTKTEVDISHLPQGMYIVHVNDVYVQKLVKD